MLFGSRDLLFPVMMFLALCAGPALGQAQGQPSKAEKAQMDEAKRAFALGTRAYERGDFEGALTQFSKAYEITGSPDLLYNIAAVADRLRRDDEALSAYEGYLKARPRTTDRGHVEGRIRALRASIDARLRAEQEAEAEAARRAAEAVERDRKARHEAEYIDPGAGPWITIGAGAAAAVTGAILLGFGEKNRRIVEDPDPGTFYKDIEDNEQRAYSLTRAGGVLLGVGVAAATAGLVWELKGARREKAPSVSLGPGRISIRGQF